MKTPRRICIAAAALAATASVPAGTINWDGDNAVGNMSYNDNWYGNSNPDNFSGWNFGNNLEFNYRNNAGQTSVYYDYSGWRNISDIAFMTTFGAATTWNGNGNGLNFNQKLENYSSNTVTLGTMNFSGAKNGAAQIELNPVNGDMSFSSTSNLYNDNSKAYHVYGNNGKTLTLNTALGVGGTAANVSLNIQQNSTVQVNAAQNYTGGTNVNAGVLSLGTSGSLASGNVSVVSGAKLSGAGTIAGATSIGGTHTVGGSNATGTQAFGNDLGYAAGSVFEWDINTGSAAYDKTTITGNLNVASGAIFKVVSSSAFSDTFWNTGHTWSDIFNGQAMTNFLVSNFQYVAAGSSVAAPSAEGFFSVSGADLKWTAVPEPSGVLVGGLVGLGLLRRRRHPVG